MPDDLEFRAVPFEIAYVWEWWQQLHKTRPVGMDIGHITYQEIDCWNRLHRKEITQFEVEALVAVEDAYMEHRRKVKEDSTPAE